MSRTGRRWLALAVAAGLGLYCATALRVRTDITAFMPAGSDTVFASLSKHLSDSELSRTVVLVLGAEELETAMAAAGRVAQGLRDHPDVAWVRDGIDADSTARVHDLYFHRRHAFLFQDPHAEAPTALAAAGLAEHARRLRRELARPTSVLIQQSAPADPLLAYPRLLEGLRANERGLELHGGRFTTSDRRHAVVFFGTRASAYDAEAQRGLQADLDALLAGAKAAAGESLRVEQSGGGRFATTIQANVQRDVQRVAMVSTAGIVLLFLVFFRSLRTLLVALLPMAAGALIAATAGTLFFGTLNGLAVAFGATLLGVSIDYSAHLLNHLAHAPSGESPSHTARRLRPTLLLGGATTIASLVGLGFSNFPGFHQMGLLATVGVGAALWIALRWLPELAGERRAPDFAPPLAAWLDRRVRGLSRRRALIAAVALASIAAGLASLSQVRWLDDLRELTILDPELLAEEESVRRKVSRFDANRFAVVLGDSWEGALAANDRLYVSLSREVEQGTLGGFRSLHSLLRSSALQRASEKALRDDPDLPARLEAAYAAEGFRPGSFTAFAEALASPPPEPLTLSELRASPLAALVRPLVAEAGERRAVLTYFEGIEDEASVRAALQGVEGALFFDQQEFVREVYGEYRQRTVWVVVTGTLAVFALLWLRYRRLRPTVAALLPSLVVALLLGSLAAVFGVHANVVHVIALVLVMGMGVDYGVFLVDSQAGSGDVGVTLLGLLLSCLTTICAFGALALSELPVLRALGVTTAAGVSLAFCLAPLSLAVLEMGSPTPDR